MAPQLADPMYRKLREKLNSLQTVTILTLPTLLDPRFKALGFLTPSWAHEAVKRLTTKYAYVISKQTPQPPEDE